MNEINDSNYELYLLLYADGGLTAAERDAVEAWLEHHPEAAAELALYADAPKLERNESVRYVATPLQQPTKPLRPALLRWSTAAVVVLALMTPALRMGTMGSLPRQAAEPAPLLAEARPTEMPAPQKPMQVSRESSIFRITSNSSTTSLTSPTSDTSPTIPPVEVIETTSLIVFEDMLVEPSPVETETLITYDRSVDWGDILLAANDAVHDELRQTTLGYLVSRALPDREQLQASIVEPMRERKSNVK
jgi:hypothetical protein